MRAICLRGRSRFPIMVIYFIGVLCLSFMSSCATSTSQRGEQVAINWTDFIQFKGILYHRLSADQNPVALKKEDLGDVYATVRFQVADHVSDANYQPKDGDAAYLPPGTAVYTLKNYQPWFRLAAYEPQTPNRLTIYEVSTNPGAKRGSDLFDISGKVALITMHDPRNGMIEKGRVKTASEINNMVSMLLTAPLVQPQKDAAITFLLELHLKDGTIVSRPYRIEPNTFDNLALPVDFRISIELGLKS